MKQKSNFIYGTKLNKASDISFPRTYNKVASWVMMGKKQGQEKSLLFFMRHNTRLSLALLQDLGPSW